MFFYVTLAKKNTNRNYDYEKQSIPIKITRLIQISPKKAYNDDFMSYSYTLHILDVFLMIIVHVRPIYYLTYMLTSQKRLKTMNNRIKCRFSGLMLMNILMKCAL